MTSKRRIAAAAAGLVSLAVLAAPMTAAAVSVDTASAPMSAKAKATAKAKANAKAKNAAAAKAPAKVATSVPAAAIAADFSSIFATVNPEFTNSGWASCAAPITWSVDTAGLSAPEAASQIANLQWALAQWTQASGLAFQFAGPQALTYNDAAFTLAPADGSAVATRHIYLDFVADASSDRIGGSTVGLATPTAVWSNAKEITSGIAVFGLEYVKKASADQSKSLFLHELGHVLGLAHANESANIMYPVVSNVTALGAGDVTGVRTMVKPCAA